jgi:ribosomal protein S27AE
VGLALLGLLERDMTKYSLAEICTKATSDISTVRNLSTVGEERTQYDEANPWSIFNIMKSESSSPLQNSPVVFSEEKPGQSVPSCARCAQTDLIIHNTYQVCTKCGWTASEPESYQLPYTENTYSPQTLTPAYDKAAKCRTQLKNLAIRNIDSVFKNKTDVDRIVQNLPNPLEPTIPEIEKSMKACGIKLIQYSHLIYQKQRGLGPNIFTSEEMIAFDHILKIAAEKFEEAKATVSPERQNFIAQKYLVYKILEYLGRTDVLPQLQTFKVHQNNKPHEHIWLKIAELANWNGV